MEARGQEPSLGTGSDALLFSFLIIEVETLFWESLRRISVFEGEEKPSRSSSNPVTVGHGCDHVCGFLSCPFPGVLLCLVAFSITGFLMNMRFCCFAFYTYVLV